jgi:cytochrome bd ubiquinol oxidase subunit II
VSLATVALIFVLAGLVFYVVLAGADFGAGFWQLAAGGGERGARIRELAHDAMAPVWEANHVWLIFVLTVTWTAFPVVFGSIASTLSIPLFIAALGIIFRGAAYALRAGARAPRETHAVDTVFALSSILTPFALGTMIGGVASGRVPVGNAAGSLTSSWLNPTSIAIGVLAVAFSAYLAAVYLAADAARGEDPELEGWFRGRALGMGLIAGVLAVAGLAVLHSDAHRVFHRLVAGPGLVGLVISVIAGAATLALVWRRRFELARGTAALAVTGIVAGWALAQSPQLLPGLTVQEAAASRSTLWATIIAVVAGGVILFPSLGLLFRLVLGGRLGYGPTAGEEAPPAAPRRRAPGGPLARAAVGCFVAGVGFLTIADAGWAHAIGATALLACIALGFLAALPLEVTAGEPERE